MPISLTTKNMMSIAKKLNMDVREGKHTNARLVIDGVLVVTTCWSHGRKEIPRGTASKILKHQLHIDTQLQAYELRDCSMKLPEYLKLLTDKQIL
jgi:hypothetical protein